jgi:hypothetical protein
VMEASIFRVTVWRGMRLQSGWLCLKDGGVLRAGRVNSASSGKNGKVVTRGLERS